MEVNQVSNGEDSFLFIYPKTHKPNHQFYAYNLRYGYLHYYVSWKEKEIRILYVYIDKEFRSKGYAKMLMKTLLENMKNEMKIKRINRMDVFLDDVSDRYDQPNNLYIQFGFQYLNLDDDELPCGPEMFLKLNV
jgi:ribosomal protein S18 acetylase RimI-like enzyme